MSRFRRDRIYASVELDRTALVRLGGDGEPREEAIVEMPLDPERPQEWAGAVRATLGQPAWRSAPRSVVLSDRLVRYVAMERPRGVRSSAELELACEARFQSSFERPANEWEIAIDARPFSPRVFACGAARAALDAIRAPFAGQGALLSLKPFLVCELQRLARRLPAECWFVAVARDCLALAGIARGECRFARVLAAERPSASLIEDTLAREALLAGEVAADAPVMIAGVLEGDAAASGLRRMDAPSWRTQPRHWTSGYRLALAERWS